MRKLLIALLVLAVVFVVADRVAVATAENQISAKVQAAYALPSRPSVAIGGFPFLTQVLAGQYQQVSVSAGSVQADGLTLRQLQANFSDVHASLSQVLGHGATTVTAVHASGSALVSYSQLRQRLPSGLALSPDGDRLKVSGAIDFHGIRVPVTATVSLSVTPAGIDVTPANLTVPGGFSIPAGALSGALSFVVPVHSLPLHLALTSVAVTPGGLRIGAAAHNVHFARA